MKSVAAIATIIGVASGTSLRAHAGAAVDNAAVEQLAAKYDCHDAAGDILVTVNNIIEANAAEKERLTTDCQNKITNHQSAWHTAETTYTMEINKVIPEETKIEEDEIAAQNGKFSDEKLKFCVPDVKDSDQTSSGFGDTSCGTTYGTEIRDIRHAKDSADDKASQTVSLHAEKKSAYEAALQTTGQEIQRLTTTTSEEKAAAHTQKTTVDDVRVLHDYGTTVTTLTNARAATKHECLAVKQARDAHIENDQVIIDKMRPLLEQLNICDSSKHTMFGNSLLELSTKAKCAALEKKATLLIQVGGTTPSGTYKDFVRRVTEETAAAATSKTSCDTTADTVYTTGEGEAMELKEKDLREYQAAYDQLVIEKDDHLKKEILRVDGEMKTKREECCDETRTESLISLKIIAEAEKVAADSAYNDKYEASVEALNTALDDKDSKIAAAAVHKQQRIDSRTATLDNAKSESKLSIDTDSKIDFDFCTSQQQVLVEETATVNELKDTIEQGGNSGSGLRVTGDDAIETREDAAAKNGKTDVDWSTHETTKAGDFDFLASAHKVTTATTALSGGNDGHATNLQACIGECDSDAQCAAGLKCFQRQHGETIPGCSGTGQAADWDYCYDPTGGSKALSGGNDGLGCPSGYTQSGGLGADKAGCGLESCGARYGVQANNENTCRDHCEQYSQCKSFSYAPENGDKNHQGKSVCTVYSSQDFNQMWYGMENGQLKYMQIACVKN